MGPTAGAFCCLLKRPAGAVDEGNVLGFIFNLYAGITSDLPAERCVASVCRGFTLAGTYAFF